MHFILGMIAFCLSISLIYNLYLLGRRKELINSGDLEKGHCATWWGNNLLFLNWLHVIVIVALIVINICI